MFRAYIYKAAYSGLFFLSIFGVFGLCCIRMIDSAISGSDVLTEFNILLDVDAYRKVIAIFAALPFTMNFASEQKSNTINFCVIRSSCGRYIISNIAVSFLSAFFVVFIGMMMFVFAYSLKIPIYIDDPNPKIPPFGFLIDKGYPLLYIAVRILIFSLSCSMWSITGLAMAALFPDVFISVCTPFIASYILERMSMQLPDMFNLWYLSLSRFFIFDNVVISFLYTIFVFLILSLFFGLIFAEIVKRRIANEFL